MSDLFNTGIRPQIDAYLKEKLEERRDYGNYWSASSAGYCMRKIIFERLKIPPTNDDPYKIRIFESGHIFHEWMQRITKNAGISIAQELELQDEDLMVRGHIDDLILIPKLFEAGDFMEVILLSDKAQKELKARTDHLILYDYKTANSGAFEFKKRQPMGHYHTMQLGTYMYMLRSKNMHFPLSGQMGADIVGIGCEDLTEGRIMSISKDDLRLDEKQLLWSEELESKVLDYWKKLNGYWANKQIPPCTCLDHDGGFMGKKSSKGKVYNPYWYNEEPCSIEWALKHKELFSKWREI